MLTDRFRLLRSKDIDKIFEKQRLINIWRKIVKDQLRSADIIDLFDHYDFNYFIEEKVKTIIAEIKKGTYRSSYPLSYRIEKKYGICRHMILPQPNDALILQALTEYLYPNIKDKQPSKQAYYSRDRSTLKKTNEIQIVDSQCWLEYWKKMQKEIYGFNETKACLIVTDLSNYFDSIDLQDLRKYLTSHFTVNETVVDLLFRIITDIAWIPDYLPFSPRGLPTINIEAIRLLAHSYLFEIDEIIQKKCSDNFVRWMDDIIIGCDSHNQAIEIVSSISEVLKSRGLALNLSKTSILDQEGGESEFCILENKYLDSIQKRIETKKKVDTRVLIIKFKHELKNSNRKHWDKIIKRYYTLFGKLECKKILKYSVEIYNKNPSLRSSITNYMGIINCNSESKKIFLELLRTHKTFDEISKYLLISVLIRWEIVDTKQNRQFLKEVKEQISRISTDMDYFCYLLFLNKYASDSDLLFVIKKYENKWMTSSFLRRQVASVLPRVWLQNEKVVDSYYEKLLASGDQNVMTLVHSIIHFSKIEKLDKLLTPYIFPEKENYFPISKFNVLCSILNSEKIRTNQSIKDKIKAKKLDSRFKVQLAKYGVI